VNEVIFLVEGEPITQFGTDGLDLTGALTRESFLDSMAAIYLTEPAVLDGDTIRVAGMANTFEATVVIQLLDIDGNVLSEEFTTASCGSGCWGTFESSVADEAAPNAIWVRLLDYSAKDGSPENAITVPVQRPDGEFAIDG
jgi:Immunoglobulin-like domain of bacterial spore germination